MMFIVMMNHSSAAHNTAMSLRSLPTLPRTHIRHTPETFQNQGIFRVITRVNQPVHSRHITRTDGPELNLIFITHSHPLFS